MSTSKPASGRRDVVGDHEIDVLRRHLRRRVLADALGLGREADQELARLLALPERGEDVGRGLEHDLGHAVALLQLLVGHRLRAGSRPRPRP